MRDVDFIPTNGLWSIDPVREAGADALIDARNRLVILRELAPCDLRIRQPSGHLQITRLALHRPYPSIVSVRSIAKVVWRGEHRF